MKNFLKNKFRVVIVMALMTTAVLSCSKKNDDEVIKPSQSSKKIEVSVLKNYMSNLVKVEVGRIHFDEKTEMFSMYGYDQFSLIELTESYERSKK